MLAALLAIGLDPKRSIIFHQDHVSRQRCTRYHFQPLPTEPEPHRTRMDSQLPKSDWETQEDDNMEGNFLCPFVLAFDLRRVASGKAGRIEERQRRIGGRREPSKRRSLHLPRLTSSGHSCLQVRIPQWHHFFDAKGHGGQRMSLSEKINNNT